MSLWNSLAALFLILTLTAEAYGLLHPPTELRIAVCLIIVTAFAIASAFCVGMEQ